MVEKYYVVDVDCDYSESRVVLAESKSEAAKKATTNHYIGVLGSAIEGVKNINSVHLASPDVVSEMEYRLRQQRRK